MVPGKGIFNYLDKKYSVDRIQSNVDIFQRNLSFPSHLLSPFHASLLSRLSVGSLIAKMFKACEISKYLKFQVFLVGQIVSSMNIREHYRTVENSRILGVIKNFNYRVQTTL